MKNKIIQLLPFIFAIFSCIGLNNVNAAYPWPISNERGYFADTATSPFGPRYDDDWPNYYFHAGLDLRAHWVPVHSVLPGIVERVHYSYNEAGWYVRIYSGECWYQYLHLSYVFVSVGDTVQDGDTIAISGDTGVPGQPHLHLGYIPWETIKKPYYHPHEECLWYINDHCPYLTVDDPYLDPYTGKIDSLTFTIETPFDELDLQHILVFLHTTIQNNNYRECLINFLDSTFQVEEIQNEWVYYPGDTIWETTITIRPENFTPFNNQIMKFKVDPTNNDIFRDSTWIGIRAVDLGGWRIDCMDSSDWGNTSKDSPYIIFNSFTALPEKDRIKIKWNIIPSYLLRGFNLYRSTDETTGYKKINQNMLELTSNIEAIEADFSFIDDNILEGVRYYYKLEQVNKDNSNEFLPDIVSAIIVPDFSINQNYPNPFNSSTVISFALDSEKPTMTTLKIYNILGQKVKTLVNGMKSAGIYNINWDGKNNYGQDVSSGVYFYVLKAENKIRIKKMLLMK